MGVNNKVDMVVTKASEDGEPIVDTNGNINQWIMGFSKFIEGELAIRYNAIQRIFRNKDVCVNISFIFCI